MKYFIDQEINLNKDDLLNAKPYAETLKKIILNAPKTHSFTIGLFGEWGSGKSSIIKTVIEDLEVTKDKKIKFITYDAWKYANDSFRRMFLFEVQRNLKHEQTIDLEKKFYSSESIDQNFKLSINTGKATITIISLALSLLFILALLVKGNIDFKTQIIALVALTGTLYTIIKGSFDELRVFVTKQATFAPEQFEEIFNEMLDKSLKKYSSIEKAYKWVKGENYEKNIDRLVIVIDNIDRCHKELAYELLTNTKNFLGNSNNIVFLIPVDDEALKKHISSKTIDYKESDEFLRKFFNVTIRIKPISNADRFDFALKICKNNGLELSPITIDIVAQEYATNPRRIIQFFNNLMIEMSNLELVFDHDFVKRNESLICKMLILREEWPKFYFDLARDPFLFNDAVRTEERIKYFKEVPELEKFLKTTHAITSELDYNAFEEILTNRKITLPTSIKEAFDNFNVDIIEEQIAKGVITRDYIINYILITIQRGVSSKRYETLVYKHFSLLLKLNERNTLSEEINNNVQNHIRDHIYYFLKSLEINSLFKYINDLETQKRYYLTDEIITIINNQFLSTPEDYYKLLLEQFIIRFQEKRILNKLKSSFEKHHPQSKFSISGNALSADQINCLISDTILTNITDKVKDENPDYQYALKELAYISQLFNIKQNISEKIFDHLLSNLGKETVSNNYNYKFVIVKLLTPFIKNIKNINPQKLSSLYNKLFEKKHSHVLNNQPFENGLISNSLHSSKVTTILEFIVEAYNCTNGYLNGLELFQDLIALKLSEKKTIFEYILKFKNQGRNLLPLKIIVLNDGSYTEAHLLLLEYYLKLKENQTLTEDEIKTEISNLANSITSNESLRPRLILLLENIISEPKPLNTFIEIYSHKTIEEKLLLSPTLQRIIKNDTP